MGCLQSKDNDFSATDPPTRKVDPRLPFETYRQVFNMRNSWKAITRCLEDTAKDTLIRLFARHPEYKALHTNFVSLDTEEAMRESLAFENAALEIFNLIDQVIENLENVDVAIDALEATGEAHGRIPGFKTEYFKDLEEPFLEAVSAVLIERYTETTERNFKNIFAFMLTHITNGFEGTVGDNVNRI